MANKFKNLCYKFFNIKHIFKIIYVLITIRLVTLYGSYFTLTKIFSTKTRKLENFPHPLTIFARYSPILNASTPTNLLPTFEEKDMFDENGKQFIIMIWEYHLERPSYKANPNECLGNVSCKIVYASRSSFQNAHAIVFTPKGLGIHKLPKKR